eukprot:CAMPEP_0196766250 /NCGR_PEP_ID=MMETSP1095-20130614/21046_1 /TAXON_ID=96789 ORGANISM="Chromulina nebulosa, Strain UTEXLB2642" /NCGR_SAMPLE_ID=MMETSP1095 /ASSEMBLY_ACC=CAM_ASM_000446 /LENGTH=1042 /DNA_ID=CAMNT_0042127139 /DNA_START=35 /DNA_END=3160 /DNA_ORIENTATION=-
MKRRGDSDYQRDRPGRPRQDSPDRRGPQSTRDNRGYSGRDDRDIRVDRGYGGRDDYGQGSRRDDRGYGTRDDRRSGGSDDRNFSSRDDRSGRDNRGYSARDDRYGGQSGGRSQGRGFQRGGFSGGRSGGRDIKHMGQIEGLTRSVESIRDSDVLSTLEAPALISATDTPSSTRVVTTTAGSIPIEIVPNYFRVEKINIPANIYQYNITIKKVPLEITGESKEDDDLTQSKSDRKLCVELLKETLIRNGVPIPTVTGGIGCAYDSSKILFTTHELPLNFPTGPQGFKLYKDTGKVYNIIIEYVNTLNISDDIASLTRLQALEIVLYSFARWDISSDPAWFIEKTKAYRSNDDEKISVGRDKAYTAIKGYVTNMKYNIKDSRYQLVVDLSVSIFVNSGPLPLVIAAIGGFRDEKELVERSKHGQLPHQLLANCLKYLKNSKIGLLHQPTAVKRIKDFGPPASSSESNFSFEGKMITVEKYYELMGVKENYKKFLVNGRLKYPTLPVINTGSASKPTYIPMELLVVAKGQIKSTMSANSPANSADVTSEVVKLAAMNPNDRYRYLTENQSILNEIRTDSTAQLFGISNIPYEPMTINALLLPPAKLQYADGVVSPKIDGQWFNKRFLIPAVSEDRSNNSVIYGVLLVTRNNNIGNAMNIIGSFCDTLEQESNRVGLKLSNTGRPIKSSNDSEELKYAMIDLLKDGAEIIIVMMVTDFYKRVKSVSDSIPIMTQCLKFERVERPPKGYHQNILLKINTKLGGLNHSLASRSNTDVGSANDFQNPRKSLPSSMNIPTMLIGIDSSGESDSDVNYHAVVGSMDGCFSKFGAYLGCSQSKTKNDPSTVLFAAITALVKSFSDRNGFIPQQLVIYRDGVSDSEIDNVKLRELQVIKDAMVDKDVKITLIVCQKRHNARLFYKHVKPDGNFYTNTCPGVCIDRQVTGETIVGNIPYYEEFFLNSHAPILGTCKPCKYVVVVNEIGFQLSQIELITYWSTYLYCRTNRSVSYPVPAYYAHWASRRAKLLADEGLMDQLTEISNNWLDPDRPS